MGSNLKQTPSLGSLSVVIPTLGKKWYRSLAICREKGCDHSVTETERTYVYTLPRMQVSQVRIPPEAANFSLKNDCLGRVVLCCFVVLLCCVVLSF